MTVNMPASEMKAKQPVSDKCPTCTSPKPDLHPAVSFEGEVEICRDTYHLTVTPENTPTKIASAQAQVTGNSTIYLPMNVSTIGDDESLRQAYKDDGVVWKIDTLHPPVDQIVERIHPLSKTDNTLARGDEVQRWLPYFDDTSGLPSMMRNQSAGWVDYLDYAKLENVYSESRYLK